MSYLDDEELEATRRLNGTARKIKVGEYVKTEICGIGKLIKIVKNQVYLDNLGFGIRVSDILKHSKNIIDLIEVGDYVNGFKVEAITIFNDGTFEIVFNEYQWITGTTAIQTIVTKEQFAQIEYKVKE